MQFIKLTEPELSVVSGGELGAGPSIFLLGLAIGFAFHAGPYNNSFNQCLDCLKEPKCLSSGVVNFAKNALIAMGYIGVPFVVALELGGRIPGRTASTGGRRLGDGPNIHTLQ